MTKRYDWMYRLNWWGVGLFLTMVIGTLTNQLWVLVAYFIGIAVDMIEHALYRAAAKRRGEDCG
jgi:uncharacterized membrane protein